MNQNVRSKSSLGKWVAVGAVALATLAGVGCGDSGNASNGDAAAGSDKEKFEQAALKHARCMRENGVDVPDPKPGRGGIVLQRRGPGGDEAALERAAKNCERYLKDLPPPNLSEEQETKLRDATLAHARCMREQGLDYPDPTFGKGGLIEMKIGKELDPSNPRVRAAEAKCRQQAPGPFSAKPLP
jgi:hypothetical protein